MNELPQHILLADDDTDDCLFFKKAIEELSPATQLTTVHDGEQLMKFLITNAGALPDVLFLDLNMPRKNGFECLSEIKLHEKIKDLPVVMFSTSYPRDMTYERNMMDMLFNIGASDYIRKPSNFDQLKLVISKSLDLIAEKKSATSIPLQDLLPIPTKP